MRALCWDNANFIQKMANRFCELLQKNLEWRSSQHSDWNLYIHEHEENLSNKFVGLENPANVCYMNSLLQQFYMNNMFCKAIIEIDFSKISEKINNENLLYQLQLVFGSLKQKAIGTYNATHLCKYVKDFDGKPLSIREQRDVDEFFNLFLERLEPCLKQIKNEKLITEIFGGSFANEIVCLDCPHRSEKVDNFSSVNLQILGKKSVSESLKEFVDEQYLIGENAYYCERCDRKMKAKKRTTFKVLPNYLVVFLKRFDYQYDLGYFYSTSH